MISLISCSINQKRPKTKGYAETVQYFNNKPFDSKFRQESEISLKKKQRSLSKKYQFAPRSTKNSFQNLPGMKIEGRKTFHRMKTDGFSPNENEFDLFLQQLRENTFKRENILELRRNNKNHPEMLFANHKNQANSISAKLKVMKIKTQSQERYRSLIPKQRVKMKRNERKYKLLNLVGNKAQLYRFQEIVSPSGVILKEEE